MPGKTVSHFELLEKLGEGGMGTVYKARDLKLERTVALKFLSAQLVDSLEERERLRHEAFALSALSHPHVATVFEVDELEGVPFIALEYLPGGTLKARIQNASGQVHGSLVVKWGIELAEGLEHAHRHGVIHRDVKSSNVMFDSEGRVKLTDFGLAHSSRADQQLWPGRIEGTMGYVPPEQLEGAPASPRGDLFSFGVLLYEMATGTLPFRGKDVLDVIEKVLSDAPPRLAPKRPDLPQAFEDIVSRLLRKKPEDRYASALQVVQALRALPIKSADNTPTQTIRSVLYAKRPFERRWLFVPAAAVIGGYGWGNAELVRRWIAVKRLPDRKHVAVLPFRSIGGDSGQQAFCDGMTETLTTALSKHGSFSVVPATESRKLDSASAARREYGVNLVIASSVQRRGDQLRVIIGLIDAVTMRQVEAETIDWPLARLHEMEDSVITKISDLLNATATGPANPMLAGASQIPSAVDAYLRGRGYLYRWDKAGNNDLAREQFEAASRVDPKFAAAQIGLAEAHVALYRQRRTGSDLDAAKAAATEAIRLNPQLAGSHIWLGAVFAETDEPDKALKELEQAVKLDPRDPVGYRELAKLYRLRKRFVEAEQTYKKAIAMRPGDWIGYSNLGFFYLTRQQYPESISQWRKVIELTPDNHLGYRNLGTTLHMAGRDPKESEAAFRKAIELNPTGKNFNNLGALLMFHERYSDAVPMLEQAVQLAAEEGANDFKAMGNLGDAYSLSGNSPEKAILAWRQALTILETRRKAKPGDAELLALQGLYEAKLGESAAAMRDAGRARLLAPENATVHYFAAMAYAVTGSQDRAMDAIRTAARQGYSREEIRRAPEFSRYRSLPAFEQIISSSASPKK